MKHAVRVSGSFLVSCLLLAPVIASSQPQEEHSHARIFESLDLKPEQKEKLRELRQQREHLHDLRQQTKEKRRTLRELLRSDSSSEQEVLDQTNRLNESMSEFNLARVKNMLEMKKILTPEQRHQALTLIQQRREQSSLGKGTGNEHERGFFRRRFERDRSENDTDEPGENDESRE